MSSMYKMGSSTIWGVNPYLKIVNFELTIVRFSINSRNNSLHTPLSPHR